MTEPIIYIVDEPNSRGEITRVVMENSLEAFLVLGYHRRSKIHIVPWKESIDWLKDNSDSCTRLEFSNTKNIENLRKDMISFNLIEEECNNV